MSFDEIDVNNDNNAKISKNVCRTESSEEEKEKPYYTYSLPSSYERINMIQRNSILKCAQKVDSNYAKANDNFQKKKIFPENCIENKTNNQNLNNFPYLKEKDEIETLHPKGINQLLISETSMRHHKEDTTPKTQLSNNDILKKEIEESHVIENFTPFVNQKSTNNLLIDHTKNKPKFIPPSQQFSNTLSRINFTNANTSQDLSYDLVRAYSHLKITKNESFMRRMFFDIFKRKTQEERLKKLIEKSKIKHPEEERIKGFNHLIEDANRRIEAHQKIDSMKKKLEEEIIAPPTKKYKESEWENIYNKRFANYLKEKEKTLTEKIKIKQNQDMEKEKQIIEGCKVKKVPRLAVAQTIKRLYEDAERRKNLNEKRKKEHEDEDEENNQKKNIEEVKRNNKGKSMSKSPIRLVNDKDIYQNENEITPERKKNDANKVIDRLYPMNRNKKKNSKKYTEENFRFPRSISKGKSNDKNKRSLAMQTSYNPLIVDMNSRKEIEETRTAAKQSDGVSESMKKDGGGAMHDFKQVNKPGASLCNIRRRKFHINQIYMKDYEANNLVDEIFQKVYNFNNK